MRYPGILALVIVSLQTISFAAPTTQPSEQEIAAAIVQLGDDNAPTREQATQWLWTAGKAAVPALTVAAAGPDPETAGRAGSILDKIRLNIFPDTPAGVVWYAEHFHSVSTAEKRQYAQALSNLDMPGFLAMDGLWSEESAAGKDAIAAALTNFHSRCAGVWIANGDADAAGELLALGSDSYGEPFLRDYAVLAVLTGRVDAKTPPTREAYVLAARGDFAGANKAWEKAGLTTKSAEFAFDTGDWATVADSVEGLIKKSSDATPLYQGLLWGELATCRRLQGDAPASAAALAREDQLHGRSAKMYAMALLLNDRVDQAAETLRHNGEELSLLDLYIAQGRFDEAAEEVGVPQIGGDGIISADLAWTEELFKLGEIKQAQAVLEPILAQASSTHAGELVRRLMDLGEDDRAADICAAAMAKARTDAIMQHLLNEVFPRDGVRAYIWWTTFSSATGSTRAVFDRMRSLLDGSATPDEIEAAAREAEVKGLQWTNPARRSVWFSTLGKILVEAHRPATALAMLQRAAQTTETPEVLLVLGDACAGIKDWPAAANAYDRAWRKNLSDATSPYLEGWALEQAGKAVEGKALMDRGELMPLADSHSRMLLVRALNSRGLWDQARQQCALVLRFAGHDFDNVDPAIILAAIDAEDRKDFVKAALLFDQVLIHATQLPFDPAKAVTWAYWSHMAHAQALLAGGDLEGAMQYVQACLSHSPLNPEPVSAIVPVLEKRGKHADAEVMYGKMRDGIRAGLVKHPRYAREWEDLASLESGCGRDADEAMKSAQRAVELDPKNAGFLDMLAGIQFNSGDLQSAIANERKCVELEPQRLLYRARLEEFTAKQQ